MQDNFQYGIGENYLKDWGIKHGLREIYQNFMDYGEFQEEITIKKANKVLVSISNDFIPQNFNFLQIGESKKDSPSARGKHGEGLKMAMLIFLRSSLFFSIKTKKDLILPYWSESFVGKTLAIKFKRTKNLNKFTVSFICDIDIFNDFRNNIITEKDIIFKDNYHGAIVDKAQGNLYSGGLFVTNLNNLKKAYDLSPDRLSLDRDRRIPSSFEVSYHTSKINEALLRQEEETAKINFVDQNYDDHAHINYVPIKQLSTIKPKEILGKIEFVATEINPETKEEEEVIINNSSIKQYLSNQSIFKTTINKIKNFIASKLGLKDLLLNFRDKYCITSEAKADFDVILDRLGIQIN